MKQVAAMCTRYVMGTMLLMMLSSKLLFAGQFFQRDAAYIQEMLIAVQADCSDESLCYTVPFLDPTGAYFLDSPYYQTIVDTMHHTATAGQPEISLQYRDHGKSLKPFAGFAALSRYQLGDTFFLLTEQGATPLTFTELVVGTFSDGLFYPFYQFTQDRPPALVTQPVVVLATHRPSHPVSFRPISPGYEITSSHPLYSVFTSHFSTDYSIYCQETNLDEDEPPEYFLSLIAKSSHKRFLSRKLVVAQLQANQQWEFVHIVEQNVFAPDFFVFPHEDRLRMYAYSMFYTLDINADGTYEILLDTGENRYQLLEVQDTQVHVLLSNEAHVPGDY